MPGRNEKLNFLHEHQKDMSKEDYEYYWDWYRELILAEVKLNELYKKLKGEVAE